MKNGQNDKALSKNNTFSETPLRKNEGIFSLSDPNILKNTDHKWWSLKKFFSLDKFTGKSKIKTIEEVRLNSKDLNPEQAAMVQKICGDIKNDAKGIKQKILLNESQEFSDIISDRKESVVHNVRFEYIEEENIDQKPNLIGEQSNNTNH
jgi:hypothetical protein